jgi:hypothetical protein
MADEFDNEGEEMVEVPEAREATGIVGTIMARFRESKSHGR